MKIKNPKQIEMYRSIRKPLPPPRKVFVASKGGAYDRKRDKQNQRGMFE